MAQQFGEQVSDEQVYEQARDAAQFMSAEALSQLAEGAGSEAQRRAARDELDSRG